ncbi:MAG: tRNA threonylcarbamoyladenosine dehydratase [Verrucomicrobiota bacterium]
MTQPNPNFRFGGIQRLYGAEGFQRISNSHVCVIGIGGVGTWAAEALARSGVGHITLVDADEVCITNVNRQIHALDSTIGHSKVQAMSERILAINPQIKLTLKDTLYTESTSEDILHEGFDYIFDAIDSIPHKCHLIVECRKRAIPVITSGGAGGRTQPGQIQIADLSKSFNDPLLSLVRKRLRQRHGFPRERRWKFKVDCVFTPEEPKYPREDGTICERREKGEDYRLNCDNGFGTSSAVTGTLGFMAAAHMLQKIAGKKIAPGGSHIKADASVSA